MNIEQAAKKWVNEWSSIPTEAVGILMNHDIDNGEDSYEMTEEREYAYGYPVAWGTMWTFDSIFDEKWAEDNVEVFNECGITAFYTESLGVVFGIDGAGYDFYESHWIPLYNARGLKWHDNEKVS